MINVMEKSGLGSLPTRIGDIEVEKMRKKWINFSDELFTSVLIETISACNSDCKFCPVSTINNKRPRLIMSDKIFRKIIDNLADLKYKGKILPYSNNEPFLDGKILEKVKYIRKKCGNDVLIQFETNGTLLTLDKLYEFLEYIDKIIIKDYTDDEYTYKNFSPNIREMFENIDRGKIKRNVEVVFAHRRKNILLSDRSGKVEGIKISYVKNAKFCDFPFHQIYFNPKGEACICCRDSYWDGVMGDINKNTLEEIWFGEKYKRIRMEFLNNKRSLEICKKCSSNGSITR